MKESMSAKQPKGEELTPEQWIPALAAFTRENRGAHARVEITGQETGYQVETENRPFDGISADTKDGERTVWISFGSTPEDKLTHGIHDATLIRVLGAMSGTGPTLEVEAKDGTRTVLELTNAAAYTLPPATGRPGPS